MIRRSTAIAAAAILLSLVLHLFGLSFTRIVPYDPKVRGTSPDEVAIGNAFEDLAEPAPDPVEPEPASEPVEPEPASVPEPEPEPPIEPELEDVTTSRALVASDNPQNSVAPDTGSGAPPKPETTEPVSPDQTAVSEPSPPEPLIAGTPADADTSPPVTADAAAQAPLGQPPVGQPEAELAPVEPVGPSPDASDPPAALPAAPEQLAALPEPLVPVPPVAPVPVPSAVPVIPLGQTPETAVTPEAPVEPVPDTPDTATPDGSQATDLAIATSPRPRLPSRSAPDASVVQPLGLPGGSTDFSALRSPPLIESPLQTYLRDRTELVLREDGRSQSGLGFLDFRNSGNAGVTNYAGQVLVHLNRAPAVSVTGLGAARVYFEINPDGSLARVDVIESTGSQDVNRAAREQVRVAAPFPRPPSGTRTSLSFIFRNN